MSGLLSRLFGGNDNSGDDIEVLRDLLMEREATLDLTAVYGEPSANTQGEPTAVFPYTTYSDGSKYSKGAIEGESDEATLTEGGDILVGDQ